MQPLKILTLDGGGLQALATLSTINAVCRAIAKQNGADRPPAPHELFDIIAGVGTGGWIALLLGRYSLDVATCTAIYMELATKVDVATSDPPSGRSNRAFKLDQQQLTTVVEEVFQRYGLDTALLREDNIGPNQKPTRCKHAFAVGAVSRAEMKPAAYELFRTYRSHADGVGTLPGPKPDTCRMPEIFAATAAAKFFLGPYKIGDTTFCDETFPQSHPVSALALEEAINLYGSDVDVSLLLNIGPGIPADTDCRELDMMSLGPISRLARRFSWPKGKHLSLTQKLLSFGTGPVSMSEKNARITSPSAMALKLENRRREDIRARLVSMYGSSGEERYYHLGPAYSAERVSLNDVSALCQTRSDLGDLKKQSIAEAEGMVRRVWVGVGA